MVCLHTAMPALLVGALLKQPRVGVSAAATTTQIRGIEAAAKQAAAPHPVQGSHVRIRLYQHVDDIYIALLGGKV